MKKWDKNSRVCKWIKYTNNNLVCLYIIMVISRLNRNHHNLLLNMRIASQMMWVLKLSWNKRLARYSSRKIQAILRIITKFQAALEEVSLHIYFNQNGSMVSIFKMRTFIQNGLFFDTINKRGGFYFCFDLSIHLININYLTVGAYGEVRKCLNK